MRRSNITAIIALIVVIVLLGGAAYFVKNKKSAGIVKDSGDNISDYSAVFLTNGQVYFGKIDTNDDKEVGLTDIYYLQVANQQVQPDTSKNSASASASPDISLVKLGNELHGPNDRMHINRDQVLFTESLKTDSKVVSAIKDYKNKK